MGGKSNKKTLKFISKVKVYVFMFIVINLNTFEKFLIKRYKKTNSNKTIYSVYTKISNLKLYYLQSIIKIVT
jgi:hypothetical protein